ncbi:mCG53903, isoform CRA_a, partial [Mus musculus]
LKKVVFPQVFGVVVVGGKAMSNRLSVEEMALCSFK